MVSDNFRHNDIMQLEVQFYTHYQIQIDMFCIIVMPALTKNMQYVYDMA